MRWITILAVFAVPSLHAQSRDSLVTGTRAGRITLGMTVDALYHTFGKDNVQLVDLYAEGMFTPGVYVFAPGLPRVQLAEALIDQLCGQFRVTSITVVGPGLRTAEGLGVGSTVADVKRLHPGVKTTREAGPVLLAATAQMSFAVSDERFADSSKVVRMWSWNGTLPDSIARCRRPT